MAETYDLAVREPELATAVSPLTGERVNRFLHVAGSPEDLVMQNKMQRKLGQLTGTCFQRCVGMDAFNALHSVTYEIDEQYGTGYHEQLKTFLTGVQRRNQVVGGAMTDVKGDRSKAPHQQDDRLPAGPAHPDRPPDGARLQEAARPQAGRDRGGGSHSGRRRTLRARLRAGAFLTDPVTSSGSNSGPKLRAAPRSQ